MSRARLLGLVVAGLVGSVSAAGTSLSGLVGQAHAAECPNDDVAGFADYLPGCGAYEMVTPPFKAGNRPEQLAAVSEDGSRVIVSDVGAFAGTESDVFGVKYELTRTSGGWVATSLAPPASTFSATDSKVFAESPDLTKTLWALRKPTQATTARDLYIRGPEGTFTKIGPTSPPTVAEGPPSGASQNFTGFYSFAGASDDLTHVLFSATGIKSSSQPWPGDTTLALQTSLYEYVGTGNTHPELVGVSDGSTMLENRRIPAGELVSSCSTFLGSLSSRDVYNAVSESGARVFFTAAGRINVPECKFANTAGSEVNELYARVDNLETVPISEPTVSQCGACQTTPRSPATFQGAARDGTKVFFLTEQELLPGAEGMNLYEYDFANNAGKKIVRVSAGSEEPEVLGVSRVSEDGSHVYFVARGVLTGSNKEGVGPTQGSPNLYGYERDTTFPAGRLVFVGTLGEEDSADWQVADERPVQASPDGRFVAFQSVADLTPGDLSTLPQVFEYDSATEDLVRVSVGQRGYAKGQSNADSHVASLGIQEFSELGGFKPGSAQSELAISADGDVLFHSVAALTALAEEAEAAGAESVYEYRNAGALGDGETFLISDGRNKQTPQADPTTLDASGENAFFVSIDQILPQDGDRQFDVYDAHLGGGFPAPPVPSVCSGEGCQNPAAAQQLFRPALTVSIQGTANTASLPPPPAPEEEPKTKAKAKVPTRAQQLAKALQACKRKPKQRSSCEKQARKRFAAKKRVKKGPRR
jgi:hypothetical protein